MTGKSVSGLLILLAGLFAFAEQLTAQSFDEALELYRQEQYSEALEKFAELDRDDRTLLFIGKTHLALGHYLQAADYLAQAERSEIELISTEATYTLAIKQFRLNRFARSLETLRRLYRSGDTPVHREAQTLYEEILPFLSARQRMDTFFESDDPELRLDLIESAAAAGDTRVARAMLSFLERAGESSLSPARLRTLRQAIIRYDTEVQSDLPTHPAPAGTVYKVGVALPSFSGDDPNLLVSRNLYSGLLFAAEEFNARHSDKKVFLRYRDTGNDSDSAAEAMHDLIWTERVDAVVGPLFSEDAARLSTLAERYQIPLITPLANSDEINEGHHYTFQLNPTFAVHGREMARFAVRELGLDTLAVISQHQALGQASALAFRHEAERLGAYVAHYLEEEFARIGYDLSEMTELFSPDPELIDSLGLVHVEGLYAPFTGQEAGTLVNLLLTDLEGLGVDMVIMGSEEWGNAHFTDAQLRNFTIYHTRSFLESPAGDEPSYFEEDFRNRFGYEPDSFARVGYDTGTFLFANLERNGNPVLLNQALRNSPPLRGLAMEIRFDGRQINRSVQIEPVTEPAIRRAGEIQSGRAILPRSQRAR